MKDTAKCARCGMTYAAHRQWNSRGPRYCAGSTSTFATRATKHIKVFKFTYAQILAALAAIRGLDGFGVTEEVERLQAKMQAGYDHAIEVSNPEKRVCVKGSSAEVDDTIAALLPVLDVKLKGYAGLELGPEVSALKEVVRKLRASRGDFRT